MSVASRRRKPPQINIVPLIDVLTILIFFFLLTMQFRHLAALNITPPKIQTASTVENTALLVISVSQEGTLFFEGRACSLDELSLLLEERTQREPGLEILLVVDEAAAVKSLTQVIDRCKLSGAQKIKLQSRNSL